MAIATDTARAPWPTRLRTALLSGDRPFPWLAPLIAMLVCFTIYPLIYNIWLSFHEYAPFKRELVWVGGENWVTLWGDERFWSSLTVTFTY
ncbi:MAG: hypothetical protein AAFZ09_19450, partial [Pseudomonadota bacterium]